MKRLIVATVALLFVPGCAHVAADYILTWGSNGGRPLSKTLDGPGVHLFNRVAVVRVQDDPPVDLVVWIIEPRPIRAWVETKASANPLADLADQSLGCAITDKASGMMVQLRWERLDLRDSIQPRGTILVLQGQGGCTRIHPKLLPAAVALANDGYRVVMPDLRSQGDSTGKELGFIVKDAQDIGRVLDWLERERLLAGKVGILGYSYGAAAGGYVATQDGRVVTCVLAGTPMTWRGLVEHRGSQNLLWRLMSDATRERTFERCSERMGYDIDRFDARKLVASTDKPLLLIHGGKDQNVPVEQAAAIHRTRPDGIRFVVFEDSGHGDFFLTHADEIRALCLSWFAEHLNTP